LDEEAGSGSYDAQSVPMAAKDSGSVRAYESDGVIDQSGSVAGDVVGQKDSGVIVLRSASRSINSTQFDADLNGVRDLVSEYGAYFELFSQSGTALEPGQSTGRTATMSVRVPTAQLDAFLSGLDAIGQTVNRNEYAEDITSQYTDTQTQLETLRAQRDQLDTMLKSATEIEDMIAITDKQQDVQTEIDSLEGQIKGWDSRVNYASVSLDLTEVSDSNRFNTIETTLGQRIAQGFSDSLNWMVGFAQDALVVLVMAGPQLVIWIPVLIIAFIIIRVVRNRRRSK
jgi:chromosome segregation ATPase